MRKVEMGNGIGCITRRGAGGEAGGGRARARNAAKGRARLTCRSPLPPADAAFSPPPPPPPSLCQPLPLRPCGRNLAQPSAANVSQSGERRGTRVILRTRTLIGGRRKRGGCRVRGAKNPAELIS
jgi:hypothetical protein